MWGKLIIGVGAFAAWKFVHEYDASIKASNDWKQGLSKSERAEYDKLKGVDARNAFRAAHGGPPIPY